LDDKHAFKIVYRIDCYSASRLRRNRKTTPLEYSRGTETILLVEDEEPLRKVVIELLTQIGYNVLSASNGKEAMDVAQTYPHRIHLLVTDVLMPEIAGPELAKSLCVARPDLRVIYISGYTHDSLAPEGVLDPGTVLVNKPFSVRVLSAKMREVLDTTH
jgi:two-component system cell cycle sensor histidine kinase/response regulator CckA